MKLNRMIRSIPDKNLYRESDELVCNDTCVGLEIEIEGVDRDNIRRTGELDEFFWQVKGDNSLRGGVELVFSRPTKSANITHSLDQLEKMVSSLRENDISPVFSERTSIHVHLDVRDMETKDIIELIKLYMLFEGIIFEYVGSWRSKTSYCRPLIGSNFEDVLHQFKDRENSYSFIDVAASYSDKYAALNSRSLSSFGSLEFRHHPGSLSKVDILEWINIIMSLKKYIENNGTIDQLLSCSGEEAVNIVFGGLSTVLTSLNLEHLFNKSIIDMKEIIASTSLKQESRKVSGRSARSSLFEQYVERNGE